SSCAQLPYQPGVHRAKSQFSSLCPLSCTFYVFENPSDFGSRKIRVDDQSGLGGNRLGKSFLAEFIAKSRSPSILPDDRFVDWFAGLPVPDDGCLPLVSDPDGGDLICAYVLVDQRFDHHRGLAGPDLIGVVLYPTLIWKKLLKFLLGNRDDLT